MPTFEVAIRDLRLAASDLQSGLLNDDIQEADLIGLLGAATLAYRASIEALSAYLASTSVAVTTGIPAIPDDELARFWSTVGGRLDGSDASIGTDMLFRLLRLVLTSAKVR